MILGHITNTYMLHKLSGRFRKLMPVLPLFAGVMAPDVLDKCMHYTLPEYPGRGVFHSAVVLTALLMIPWIATGRRFMLLPVVYLGALLHLAQDTVEPVIALWPFWGDLYVDPPVPILKKIEIFYVEKSFSWLWVVEMVSLAYCLLYLVAGFMSRLREKTLRTESQ